MSGRLVILPKKSYCPWKPENVERVLRDERLERDRQEKESQLCHLVSENHHSTSRLSKLRQLKQTAAAADTVTTTTLQLKEESNSQNVRMQHVNLFQKEEEECADGSLVEGSQANKAAVGIMPVMLGQSELQARGDNLPFYLRAHSHIDRYSDHAHICPKEESRKDNLDPMKYFIDSTIQTPVIDAAKSNDTQSVSSDSSRKRRRKHRSRSRSRHEKKKQSKKVRRHEGGRDKKSKRSDHDRHDDSQQKSMSPKKASSTVRDDRRRVENLQERRQLQHNSRESNKVADLIP